MEIIIAAVLNSIAYQHKTEAAAVIPEPKFRPFNPSHVTHFPKDTEEDLNSFGITGLSKIASKTSDFIKK
jgi:hypothetical protein